MKKIFCLLFLITSSFLFATTYKIRNVDYDSKGWGKSDLGKTKAYSIATMVPVDYDLEFSTEKEIEKYIDEYLQKLSNTRAFDKINIEYLIDDTSDEKKFIDMKVSTKDSFHLIVLPYPKYDSNTGFNLKLKIKDTNFLGSLNTLSSDLFFLFASKDSDNPNNQFGFNFQFDYPFPMGKINATLLNNYQFAYTVGDSQPEFNFNTGLKLSYPIQKSSIDFLFNQFIVNNLDYEIYNDSLYFSEEAKLQAPVHLYTLPNNTNLNVTPYFDFYYIWDKNQIDTENTALLSPKLTAGITLSNAKVNWDGNMRNGYSVSLTNSYSLNTGSNVKSIILDGTFLLYKKVNLFDFDSRGWKFLNNLDLNLRVKSLINISTQNPNNKDFGTKIGEYLRGISDEQYYIKDELGYLCRTPSALIFNFDLPIQIIKTNFFFDFINFELQFSPFFDMAIIYNKYTETKFSFSDGLYSAGFEFLAYPKKITGIIVRGSLGFDLRRLTNTSTPWYSNNVRKWEASIGVGLFY